MTFVLRDARPSDLPAVMRLAAILNTVNLPHDEDTLRELLDVSSRSFNQRIRKPLDREYLFVMEDIDTGTIIGTSQIIAQHGTREAPHIYFDVLEEERYSESIDRHFRHRVLRLGFNHEGPTEIGGLVLDPAHRRVPGKLGKQLSYVRFLFMAARRGHFRNRLLAELLPPLGDGGRSTLWEALGRRFTGMSYLEADRVSKNNKEFIKGLFPGGMIYTTLFSDEAQQVIGEVGAQTEGVKKMLMHVGFAPVGRIDPFDGGPHFEANMDDVAPVQHSKPATVAMVADGSFVDAAGESQEGLLAIDRPKARKTDDANASRFRAVYTDYRLVIRDGEAVVEVPALAARVLQVDAGDTVWALPFAMHHRL
jgi:arginine N-succinyltransferase